MIDTLIDFVSIFIFLGCAVGTIAYIGVQAAYDGLLEEYLGVLAIIIAFIWATAHLVGM